MSSPQAGGDFLYARGKVLAAAHVLATHPGDIKVRLRAAYLEHLAFAFASDLPEELQPVLKSIHDQITKKEPRWSGARGVLMRRYFECTGKQHLRSQN